MSFLPYHHPPESLLQKLTYERVPANQCCFLLLTQISPSCSATGELEILKPLFSAAGGLSLACIQERKEFLLGLDLQNSSSGRPHGVGESSLPHGSLALKAR